MRLLDRFWAQVDERGEGQCWPWTGSTQKDTGYGRLALGRRGLWVYTHRFALILASGIEGYCALHSCDNPPCCNAAHLRWGDRVDNAQDVVDRARQPSGSARSNSKLTETDVVNARAARAAGHTVAGLAVRYGVSLATMSRALSGQTWRRA